MRYGGHTLCVAVCHDGEDVPHFVLDAGTGLRNLSNLLDGAAYQGTILLGHLHWDHTHGIPFFPAGLMPDADIRVLVPAQGDVLEVLARVMSPPHFPVRPDELVGEWRFEGLETGEHTIEGFNILAREVPHKGGRMFGYRITDNASTFTYVSDHGPIEYGPGPDGFGEYHETILELCSGVDVLIHDAQYTAEEFFPRAHYGHSAIDYAVGLAIEARVKKLLLFHHDPARTDDDLDRLLAQHRATVPEGGPVVEAAIEGAVVEVGSASPD